MNKGDKFQNHTYQSKSLYKRTLQHDKYNSNTSHSNKTFNQNKQPFRQNLCYACMHTKICAHSKTINTDMNVQHAREHIQGHSVNHELIPTIIPKQSPAPCCTLQVQRNQQDQANNKNGLQGQDFEKANPNQSRCPSTCIVWQSKF